ncbi:hypothetical protein [Bradyrhizobium sp. B117]|uniref:hypothetical protein n=1 Tax=Bradyrhizobium sp. B117 TaxID=3140246 RepID=UPI003182DB42
MILDDYGQRLGRASPEMDAEDTDRDAASIPAVEDGRIHIEKINAPFLFTLKASGPEFGAGIKYAIEKGRNPRERNLCSLAGGKQRLADDLACFVSHHSFKPCQISSPHWHWKTRTVLPVRGSTIASSRRGVAEQIAQHGRERGAFLTAARLPSMLSLCTKVHITSFT